MLTNALAQKKKKSYLKRKKKEHKQKIAPLQEMLSRFGDLWV